MFPPIAVLIRCFFPLAFSIHSQLANEEDPGGCQQVAAAAEAPPPYSSILLDGAGKFRGTSTLLWSQHLPHEYVCPPKSWFLDYIQTATLKLFILANHFPVSLRDGQKLQSGCTIEHSTLFKPPSSVRVFDKIVFSFGGRVPTAVPNVLYVCARPQQYLTAWMIFWDSIVTPRNFSFNAVCTVQPLNPVASHHCSLCALL